MDTSLSPERIIITGGILYLLVNGVADYVFGLGLLRSPTPEQEQRFERARGVNVGNAYAFSLVAFASTLLMSFVEVVMRKDFMPSLHTKLALFTHVLSTVTLSLMLLSDDHILVDSFGSVWTPLRYILWLFTTMIILWTLATIAGVPKRHAALDASIVGAMVISGMISQMTNSNWLQIFFAIVSTVFFFFVQREFDKLYRAIICELGTDSRIHGLHLSLMLSRLVWALFPLKYGLSACYPRAVLLTEGLYEGANFAAKAIFASALTHNGIFALHERRTKSLSTVESEVSNNAWGELGRRDSDIAQQSAELEGLESAVNDANDMLRGILEQNAGGLDETTSGAISKVRDKTSYVCEGIAHIVRPQRGSNGLVFVNVGRVDVKQICSEVATAVSALASPSVQIICDIADNLPNLSGDANRIRQAVHNLMHNACRFTIEGHIRISAWQMCPAHSLTNEDSDTVDNRYIVIRVEDTGPGIRKVHHDDVWRPFKKFASALSGSSRGVGLGLTMVQQVARIHGGTVTLDSKLNKGSTFELSLPVAGENLTRAESRPCIRLKGSSGKENAHCARQKQHAPSYKDLTGSPCILCIDDDAVNQTIVSTTLNEKRMEVVPCLSKEEALSCLHNMPALPDVVLISLEMPEQGGVEACRRIREEYMEPELPVLFMAFYSKEGQAFGFMEVGANDWIAKPLKKEELYAKINAQIRVHRAHFRSLAHKGSLDTPKHHDPGRTLQGRGLLSWEHITGVAIVTVVAVNQNGEIDGGDEEALRSLKDSAGNLETLAGTADGDCYLMFNNGERALASFGLKGDATSLEDRLKHAIEFARSVILSSGDNCKYSCGVSTGEVWGGFLTPVSASYQLFGPAISWAWRLMDPLPSEEVILATPQAAQEMITSHLAETVQTYGIAHVVSEFNWRSVFEGNQLLTQSKAGNNQPQQQNGFIRPGSVSGRAKSKEDSDLDTAHLQWLMNRVKCLSLRELLGLVELEKFVGALEQHEITTSTLDELSDEDLKCMGVTSLGARKRIRNVARDWSRFARYAVHLDGPTTMSSSEDNQENVGVDEYALSQSEQNA